MTWRSLLQRSSLWLLNGTRWWSLCLTRRCPIYRTWPEVKGWRLGDARMIWSMRLLPPTVSIPVRVGNMLQTDLLYLRAMLGTLYTIPSILSLAWGPLRWRIFDGGHRDDQSPKCQGHSTWWIFMGAQTNIALLISNNHQFHDMENEITELFSFLLQTYLLNIQYRVAMSTGSAAMYIYLTSHGQKQYIFLCFFLGSDRCRGLVCIL